ncbi:hypothetical protein [Streptosporangium sp. NPDC000396]
MVDTMAMELAMVPTTRESFVKLGRYLRKVIPAVHRELNSP